MKIALAAVTAVAVALAVVVVVLATRIEPSSDGGWPPAGAAGQRFHAAVDAKDRAVIQEMSCLGIFEYLDC